ncbi:MAG: protein-ADP-ribose hydrolase [Methanobrevibacter wolinii]
MNKDEIEDYLLKELIEESNEKINIPKDYESKRILLRSLMNIRLPGPISKEFLEKQDELLSYETNSKKLVSASDIKPIAKNLKIGIFHGDITTLKVDAIVNAANSKLLGCFIPLHNCIDNVIHSAAGIQLRYDCNKIMLKQGHDEKVGQAKITKGYNLPAKYVIHTVGPALIQKTKPNKNQEELLKSSYINSLKLADKYHLKTIAFPNISTGVFNYPKEDAAKAAYSAVNSYLNNNQDTSIEMVIFDVFEEEQLEIYKKLLED